MSAKLRGEGYSSELLNACHYSDSNAKSFSSGMDLETSHAAGTDLFPSSKKRLYLGNILVELASRTM